MAQPSKTVQRALSAALLELLQSPELTPEDSQWLRHFAMRTIAEFNLTKPKDDGDTAEKPIAA